MTETTYNRKWIYGALIVQSIIIIILLFNSCNKSRETTGNVNAREILDGLVKPEQVYTDDSGRTHLIIKANADGVVVKKPDNLESLIYKTAAHVLDSAAKDLNIKPKQVEQIQTISSTIQYINEPFLQRQVDSLKDELRYVQTFNNQYLSLTANSGNLKDSTDKGTFDYKYNAQINSTQYYKRAKVLGFLPIGKKVSYLDLTSTDPKATINGVSRYTVKQEQPAFGVRLQASASYNLNLGRFSAGPGIRVDLGRTSFYLGTYKNFQNGQWTGVGSMYVDAIRF